MTMSAPCRIVQMTADCLGLDYDFRKIDLMTGEHTLNESRPIAGYLVNKYGKDDKLYPKDPVLRAKVDQRLYFDMGTFYAALGKMIYPVVFGIGAMPGKEEMDKLNETLGWLD